MWRTNRFVITWIVLILGLTSCARTKTKCPIESLIIDEHLLPEGTYVERLISPISEKPKESVARSFYYAPYDIFHAVINLSLIHISEPTRLLSISYAVFCL